MDRAQISDISLQQTMMRSPCRVLGRVLFDVKGDHTLSLLWPISAFRKHAAEAQTMNGTGPMCVNKSALLHRFTSKYRRASSSRAPTCCHATAHLSEEGRSHMPLAAKSRQNFELPGRNPRIPSCGATQFAGSKNGVTQHLTLRHHLRLPKPMEPGATGATQLTQQRRAPDLLERFLP